MSMDRLGSDVRGTKYFPYGEEPTATTQDRLKFATYHRDGTTGLDYADQRYYSSRIGRFLTPDPYQASGGVANPGSWNRYAYVGNDPVNYIDPQGLEQCGPGIDFCITATGLFGSGGGSGRGVGRPAIYAEVGINTQATGGEASENQTIQGMGFHRLGTGGVGQKLINLTLVGLEAALDEDCADWLKTGLQAQGMTLEQFFDYVPGRIGHAEAISDPSVPNSQVNAVTGVGLPGIDIAVGLRGAFGNSSAVGTNDGKIKTNTDRARVFILLHEFGHLLDIPGFQADRGNSAAGSANNQMVEQNCGKTLNRFDGSRQWNWRRRL